MALDVIDYKRELSAGNAAAIDSKWVSFDTFDGRHVEGIAYFDDRANVRVHGSDMVVIANQGGTVFMPSSNVFGDSIRFIEPFTAPRIVLNDNTSITCSIDNPKPNGAYVQVRLLDGRRIRIHGMSIKYIEEPFRGVRSDADNADMRDDDGHEGDDDGSPTGSSPRAADVSSPRGDGDADTGADTEQEPETARIASDAVDDDAMDDAVADVGNADINRQPQPQDAIALDDAVNAQDDAVVKPVAPDAQRNAAPRQPVRAWSQPTDDDGQPSNQIPAYRPPFAAAVDGDAAGNADNMMPSIQPVPQQGSIDAGAGRIPHRLNAVRNPANAPRAGMAQPPVRQVSRPFGGMPGDSAVQPRFPQYAADNGLDVNAMLADAGDGMDDGSLAGTPDSTGANRQYSDYPTLAAVGDNDADTGSADDSGFPSSFDSFDDDFLL